MIINLKNDNNICKLIQKIDLIRPLNIFVPYDHFRPCPSLSEINTNITHSMQLAVNMFALKCNGISVVLNKSPLQSSTHIHVK